MDLVEIYRDHLRAVDKPAWMGSKPAPSVWVDLQTFAYIRSVRRVIFVPEVTSSPECSKNRCWKINTRPTFGFTFSPRFIFPE